MVLPLSDALLIKGDLDISKSPGSPTVCSRLVALRHHFPMVLPFSDSLLIKVI